MQAVIMAGGKGTRLSSITNDVIPKPMVNLKGKPILEYQIHVLRNYGITDILLVVGHLHEKIEEYFKNGEAFGVNIRYIVESEPLGTAGAFYYLKDFINDDFLFLFGDLIFDISITRMLEFHRANQSKVTLLIHPSCHPYDSDLILTDENGKVIKFDSKNNHRDYYYKNMVNAGIYIISGEILKEFNELKRCDFEKDILHPMILKRETVYGYRTPEYVKDVGTPERLLSTEEDISKNIVANKNLDRPQKCIFLDRDGTINKQVGLLSKLDQFELEESVSEALKLLHKSDYLAVIITNQSVVARNMCTISDLENIHNKMETLMGIEGAFIDGIEFCPHHPDKGYPEENPLYKIECDCRKPNIGLIKKSAKKYNIDLSKSWFIGDSVIDIQTGKNAGMGTILLKTGVGGRDNKLNLRADFIADNLLMAVEYIIHR